MAFFPSGNGFPFRSNLFYPPIPLEKQKKQNISIFLGLLVSEVGL